MFPKQKEIELPLLEEIRKRGGQAKRSDKQLYQDIAKHFPQLTQADLIQRLKTGANKWENLVQWAIRYLIKETGELVIAERGERGVYQITQKGLQRLGQPPPPPSAPSQPVTPDIGLHEQMQAKLEEIGRILGKFAQNEFHTKPFTYDTVWKATAQLPPSHVFEVQDKGNLDSALVKLKHASDIWPCQLFLVVTGEKDREKAQELLAEHFAGAFHEIAYKTTILSPEDIGALYKVLSQYKDIMGKWR